jgi:hypothetical protein
LQARKASFARRTAEGGCPHLLVARPTETLRV